MSSKLKKAIIIIVVLLVVAVGGLVGFSVLSKLSTATIYDIRLLDENSEQIHNKTVYLTSEADNHFYVSVYIDASDIVNCNVKSSDTNIAVVTFEDGLYKITYKRAGKVIITAYCDSNNNVSDDFELTVNENMPSSFNFDDEKADGDKEITVFADNLTNAFGFKVESGLLQDNINLSSLQVLDTYNKDIFESIYIDETNAKLVVEAKQSEISSTEYITLKSNYVDENGKVIAVNTFVIKINVEGYYARNLQLVLSSDPMFNDAVYVLGEGYILDNEIRIPNVYLTKDVNMIFAKVRVVYTNHTFKDITVEADAETRSHTGSAETKRVDIGNYYNIQVNANATIRFIYAEANVYFDFNFKYLDPISNPNDYNNFTNNLLYTKINVEGKVVYKYIYWDERFKRKDTITDSDGNIIGFVNGNPKAEVIDVRWHFFRA